MSGEEYEYVKAIVDCGELRWEYKLKDSHVTGRMRHDEDVTEWSKREIVDLTCSMLDIPADQRGIVEVEYR